MKLIDDIVLVQKHSIKHASKSIIKNWPIIFTGLVYVTLNILALIVINTLFRGVLSLLAGIVFAIVSSSLISSYLYLLSNIINNNRITLQSFKDGFKEYLWKVYGIFFIAWLASYLLSTVSSIFGKRIILLTDIIKILALVLLNALPEVIYQKHYSSADSIMYAIEFIRENWLNWFLPNIIFTVILYFLTGKIFTNLFTIYIDTPMVISIEGAVRYIVAQTIFSYMMIYRGYLFKILSTSTPRKRAFMRNLYE
ncbi:MAG: hypothetical protein GX080_07175 [Tissierellia bacterium]|nr:hypothetical protein [Tissierellia bacterium]